MQTLFVILTTVVIGVMAKIRGRSVWGWAILAAVTFLVVDTVVALSLLSLFKDAFHSFHSDAGVILTFGIQKLLLSAAFVALFHAKVKREVYSSPADRYYARQPGGAEYLYSLVQLRDAYDKGEITDTWTVRRDDQSLPKPVGDVLANPSQQKNNDGAA